jgi:hypothetical protein
MQYGRPLAVREKIEDNKECSNRIGAGTRLYDQGLAATGESGSRPEQRFTQRFSPHGPPAQTV